MPELLEVELYRRAAERALHRVVARVEAPDAWYLKGGLDAATLRSAVEGRSFTAARRTGKQLLLDTSDDGPVLGLHFGMTGRLLVDQVPAIERLEYGSTRDVPAWDRLVVHLADGGQLRMRDPRRLGGVTLDPDEARLGVDAASVKPAQLARLLGASRVALKARLLDQRHLAGVGNLLADDALWRAKLDPGRPADSLDAAEVRRLHRALAATLRQLGEQGGSHTGVLQAERHADGHCPRCGTALQHRTIGGRSTWSCPREQR